MPVRDIRDMTRLFQPPWHLYHPFNRSGQASQAVSSWDLPSQTTLKFRKRGQNSEAELRKRDVRAEVEDSERRALEEKPATIARRYGEIITFSYWEQVKGIICQAVVHGIIAKLSSSKYSAKSISTRSWPLSTKSCCEVKNQTWRVLDWDS